MRLEINPSKITLVSLTRRTTIYKKEKKTVKKAFNVYYGDGRASYGCYGNNLILPLLLNMQKKFK